MNIYTPKQTLNERNILRWHKAIIIGQPEIHRYSNENSPLIKLEFDQLQSFYGCSYLIYVYENLITNEKIIYSSNWDWQKRLIDEKLINECHIFKAALKAFQIGRNAIVLPWKAVPFSCELEKEVHVFRREYRIANGAGFGYTDGSVREFMGIAGDTSDIAFEGRVFQYNLIEKTLKVMRENFTYPNIRQLALLRDYQNLHIIH